MKKTRIISILPGNPTKGQIKECFYWRLLTEADKQRPLCAGVMGYPNIEETIEAVTEAFASADETFFWVATKPSSPELETTLSWVSNVGHAMKMFMKARDGNEDTSSQGSK